MSKTIENICSLIIQYAFYSLFIIIPLILTPWNYELFEYNKMMAVYAITAVIMGAWIIKMIINRKIELKRTPFDIFLFLFLLSQILSTLFSIDIHTSIWGYYSRFHGGLLSTITYTLLYYAFISNLSDLRYLSHLIKGIIITGIVVAFYGFLEHFGIDKNLWVQDVQNRVFSTLGQPNWLGAYLAVIIPIVLGLMIFHQIDKENQKSKLKAQNRIDNWVSDIGHWKLVIGHWSLDIGYWILVILFYSVLLFTKSRSAIMAFWIADMIFWALILFRTYFAKHAITRIVISIFLILNSCFLILSFFIGGSGLGPLEKYTYPMLIKKTGVAVNQPKPLGESIINSGVTESGEIRKIVWAGAWDIFKHNPVLGSGVETFAYAYYQYRPAAHNMTSEWDFLYNKAHNEYLNFLATTGILGFGTWMGFIVTFVIWALKKLTINNEQLTINNNNKLIKKSSQLYIVLGLFTGWLTILITDFFGFSVVIIGLFFYLIPAVCFVLMRDSELPEPTSAVLPFNNKTKIKIAAVIIGVILIEYYLINLWTADVFFARGYKQNRSMQFAASYDNLATAIKLNPNEPYYADELAYASSILAAAINREEKNSSTSALLASQALALSDKVFFENPKNINFIKSRIRILSALSTINIRYKNSVMETLEIANSLAPTDPRITYNLAVIYAQAGLSDKAREFFLKTIKLKPDYRDGYYGLALLYKDQKNDSEAKNLLNFILEKLDPNDTDAKKKLEEWGK